MKKNRIYGYLILGILLVLVTVVGFVVPTAKTGAFRIAYAFTVVAFSAQIVIWNIAFGNEEPLKSKFLGFSVVHIGIVYLIVQIIAFAVFLFIPTLSAWSAVAVCALIVGISTACMVTAKVGCNEIERVEEKVQKKFFCIKELQVDIEMLADVESDEATKTTLSQLAEKIRFSDPMSNEQLADLEGRIAAKVAELKTAANKAEIISELNSLLDERNKKCKNLK